MEEFAISRMSMSVWQKSSTTKRQTDTNKRNNKSQMKELLQSLCITLAALGSLQSANSEYLDMDGWTADKHWAVGDINCTHGLREFNRHTQKQVYTVGVHAPAGIDKAWNEFNMTFETYLTEVVGKRFDPPIEFQMKPSEWPLLDWIDNAEDVDFMYSDTGLYSCIGTEIGSQPLATTISSLESRGNHYELDMYGGTILALASNNAVNTIEDLKDKVIAGQAFSVFAAGQSQFYVMHKAGLDYIMDPKQVIFTGNHDETVQGVLSGKWDVGFVPSGRAERTVDEATGEYIDSNLFKVIEPKIAIMNNGDLFPFLHSTPVFPEWPLFAKEEVDGIVSEEVAIAMMEFGAHKRVGTLMHQCMEDAETAEELELCNTMPPVYFDPAARCDTTRELAELAYQAGTSGHHSGMRPAKSHFQVRTMQQDAGFIIRDDINSEWRCERASKTYDGITCPEGHYKIAEHQFDTHCDNKGLPCPEGATCYCRPCVEAYEVDVFPWDTEIDGVVTEDRDRCDKMSLCAEAEQNEEIRIHAYDNLQRSNATVTALVHLGQESRYLEVIHNAGGFNQYEFLFLHRKRGVAILEVFFDGVQIPESPFRIQVTEKKCAIRGMVASEDGVCECSSSAIDIFGECVSEGVFAGVVSGICVMIGFVVALFYIAYKKKKNDEVWHVNVEELHFNHPVEIVGQGAFGVVLLAEYRGTKVAIKRVLAKKDKSTRSGSVASIGSVGARSVSEDGEHEDVETGETPGTTSGAGGTASGTTSGFGDLDFLGGFSFNGRKRGRLNRLFGRGYKDYSAKLNLSILGSVSAKGSTSQGIATWLFPSCNETARRHEEFKEEMRLLSRLRHPCITTVMGAVMNGIEPMMVMEYMENGSLYDLLRNESFFMGGEIILQVVRDIAQGLLFLHSSKPAILHGDLKAKNILIDSRFRAKVCDFGLAVKGKNDLSGTLYWLAPEYLRRRSEYNATCDIYSVGMILYEIYSRKTPYEGEQLRKVLRKVCDPRINYRPALPGTCPKRMTEVMTRCWSSDASYRHQAKDLDMIFGEMTSRDADPLLEESNTRVRTEVATGDMLYKVFPKKVADKLRHGEKVEPENHDNVTIFFSDIVRFTDISRALSPVKVCNMLDRLYLAFDELSTKHGVFKVETIGDAWMGVTNLEGNQEGSHAKRVAEFAIDAVEAAGKVLIDADDPSAGHVHIRVGLHSGPVVSNVIGSLNPRYGLFGDTVNTASRMESLSVSGRIQCSDAAANFLKEQAPAMPLLRRGKVAVKGKGNMVTYWVGNSSDPSKALQANGIGSFDDPRPVVNFQEKPQILTSPSPIFRHPITPQRHDHIAVDDPSRRTTMAGAPRYEKEQSQPHSVDKPTEADKRVISFQRSLSQ
ncbi:unnamed protein product [Cylindrotheca closterium]|uniref:guanylate cyclase n=1 Tax=Cylindrotheca closterium TaxID=2856 RepID=A0AAD2CR18_9STRA|nr:unnamed protein product [Cylindrotheca closterium]